MIQIGVCHRDEEVAQNVEEYLRIRNCCYELKCFYYMEDVFESLISDGHGLDILFLEVSSEKDWKDVELLRQKSPWVKLILILPEDRTGSFFNIKLFFFAVALSELKNRLPEIMDKCLVRERYMKRERLAVNSKGKMYVVELEDLVYVEREKRNTILILRSGEELFSTLELPVLQDEISRDDFVRCHNSYIVNLNYVKELSRGEFILKDGRIIPVSRRYLDEVRRRLKCWTET